MAIQIWDAQAGQYKSADLARFGGAGTLKEALVWDGTQYVRVWPAGPLPVVQITGTSTYGSRDQFRQACIDHGTTFDTVEVLPFRLDTSQATVTVSMFRDCSSLTQVPDLDTSQVTTISHMFRGCSSLTSVPDLDTSQVTDARFMFRDCSSLTDGNVRLIGRHPDVRTDGMIQSSGLTREPFYDTNGNPI